MPSVAIVSAIAGGYDKLLPPAEQDIPVTWTMVTDTPAVCPPWQVICDPRPELTPRMAARLPKANPRRYAPGADVVIWIDGNIEVTSPSFARWCVRSLGDAPLAQMPVPRTLRQETDVIAPMAKYGGQPFRQQLDHYLGQGLPDGWGLWWCGFMIRGRSCPGFGDAWLAETKRWSADGGTAHDQVSLSWLLWQLDVRPAPVAVHVPEVTGPRNEPAGSPVPRPFRIHDHPDR